jgi:hypothetical protein
MAAVRIDSQAEWDIDMWAGVAMLIINLSDGWPLRERVQRLRDVREPARADGQSVVAQMVYVDPASPTAGDSLDPQRSVSAFIRRAGT